MAGRLVPYVANGPDEESVLYVNVEYITSLTVILDPVAGVWEFTIKRLKGAPLTSLYMTQAEAMAELDEWRFLVNAANSGQPVI